jgi:Leucine-rich repeat (LRR) protein
MMFIIISLLLFFVNFAIATDISCDFVKLPNQCSIPQSPVIQVTTQNEPITVIGNIPDGFDAIENFVANYPHKLNFIPTKLFDSLRNLQSFQVDNVEVTTMTTDAFQNCLKMVQIFVRENNFPNVPAGFAQSCSALKSLHLQTNHIKTFDKDALKGLVSLETIQLSFNEITTLDVLTFTHTPNLENIFMNQNALKSIHPDLFATNGPTQLDFTGNQIQSLPVLRMKSYDTIFMLSFGKNQINSIDRQFITDFFSVQGHVPTQVQRNTLGLVLNDNICNSGSYQGAQVVLSNLESFKPCFDNWDATSSITSTSTTTLNPLAPSCESHRDCRFYLDHEKVYVCVLENVDLILSSIGGDHQTIGLKKYADADVKAVYLKKSILSKIPSAIFKKFPNIDFLSAVQCKMTIINENTFELCGNLKTFDATDNLISRITKTSLKNCQSLETMIMTGNLELEEIESDLFVVDPNLKHIVLNRRGSGY